MKVREMERQEIPTVDEADDTQKPEDRGALTVSGVVPPNGNIIYIGEDGNAAMGTLPVPAKAGALQYLLLNASLGASAAGSIGIENTTPFNYVLGTASKIATGWYKFPLNPTPSYLQANRMLIGQVSPVWTNAGTLLFPLVSVSHLDGILIRLVGVNGVLQDGGSGQNVVNVAVKIAYWSV